MSSDESKLLAEISEYVVTDHLEKSFEHLLNRMNLAMPGPVDSYGRCIWVSGFYGSGKSSFTKYLGFALDQNKMLDGKSFLIHLQDRLCNDSTKALLNVVSKNLNPHVVFLDLAREISAGSDMMDISSVLRNKVLRDCGYSDDIEVAELELMLDERVQEIIDLVKRKSGKNNIIFILDDVGEYIGTSGDAAFNFYGLVERLVYIGKGSIWLFATGGVDLSDNRYLSRIAGKFSINVHLESR